MASSFYKNTNWPINLQDCVFNNHDAWLEQNNVSWTPVYTIYTCLCAIALEVIVHLGVPCLPKVSVRSDQKNYPSTISLEPRKRQPSKLSRAYRFILATPFFIIVLVLFGMRMDKLKLLRIWPDCKSHRGAYHVQPNWAGLFFGNVFPLISAICAWSRTVVDIYLYRWGTSVPYPSRHYPLREGSIGWPPVLPLYVAYLIIAFPISWVLKSMGDESGNYTKLGDEERDALISTREDEHYEVEKSSTTIGSFPVEAVIAK